DAAVNPTAFDTSATASFQNAFAASDFPYSVRVFDSLGAAHDVQLFFKKTGDNTWEFHLAVDAGETTGGTAGQMKLINGAGGTIQFNPDGSLQSATGLTGTVQFAGAASQTITFDLGTAGGRDGLTQFAGANGINFVSRDGFGAGGLASLN